MKRYDIPTNKAPKLLLKGTGNLKGSSVGYRFELTLGWRKKVKIYTLVIVISEPSEDK